MTEEKKKKKRRRGRKGKEGEERKKEKGGKKRKEKKGKAIENSLRPFLFSGQSWLPFFLSYLVFIIIYCCRR